MHHPGTSPWGWFDFEPPQSLVTPDGNNSDLLRRLRQCAAGLSCGDIVIRARLACARADASLTASSTAADVDSAFMPLMHAAGAGRYLQAGGLVFARAARAFAMHGATARAIDLWRQAILLSSETRLYGDVAGCRRALNAAILDQPVPALAELAPPRPLPNADRLLAVIQSAELYALRAAHAGKLPDAFGVARRRRRGVDYGWHRQQGSWPGQTIHSTGRRSALGDIASAGMPGCRRPGDRRPGQALWPCRGR